MKRFRVVKDFLLCLKDNDVAIFSGEDLSREAFQHDRKGNFYVLDTPGLASSLALGMAMNTDKRIFLFTGDGEFMFELGAFAQVAISRCKNLFCVIFDNGCYQAAGGQPTIFGGLSNGAGLMFNLGFVSYDLTPQFKNRVSISKLSGFVSNLTGPSSIIIKVNKGYKKGLKDVDHSKIEIRDRLVGFIKNKKLGTSQFVSPITFEELDIDLVGGVS